MPYPTKNLEGQQFGQWTVLKYGGIIKNNSYWYCRCSCGFEKLVKAQYLINGTSTKCQQCAFHKRENLNTICKTHWKIIKYNANKRNILFNVTKEQCYDLIINQNFKCALSGVDLYLSKNESEHLEGKTTASLDRIDSNKGYEIGNLQWLHKDINIMKHTFDQEYFIKVCNNIVNYVSSPI